MANRSTPEISTMQTEVIPPNGSTFPYLTPSKPGSGVNAFTRVYGMASSYVNCHPVKYKQFGADAQYRVMSRQPARSTSGGARYDTVFTVTGLNRYVFFQRGSSLEMTTNSEFNVGSIVALPSTNRVCGAALYFDTATQKDVVAIIQSVAVGSVRLTYIDPTPGTPTILETKTVNIVFSNPVSFNAMVFLDGYLCFVTFDGRIFNSDPGNPRNWTPANNFIKAEQFQDSAVSMFIHHNNIVLFGNSSIEFFYNAGNLIGSPLSRNVNYSVNFGAQVQTMVPIRDEIFFIGTDYFKGLGRSVYKLSKFQITRDEDLYMSQILREYAGTGSVTMVPMNHYGGEGILVTIAISPGVLAPGGAWSFFRTVDDSAWSSMNFDNQNQFVPLHAVTTTTVSALYGYNYSSSSVMQGYILRQAPSTMMTLVVNENVTSYITTPVIDFQNDALKKWIYLTVRGAFSGSIQLEYVTNSFLPIAPADNPTFTGCGTKTPTTSEDPIRWRNLGSARSRVFRISIPVYNATTNVHTPFMYDGLEIRYNQGPY